ncbi:MULTISPECIES: heparan-alpha-glucosaminide N-acetyltransferase domain-containing protein [unclassified Dehalobacter]|uniref:acyltransferase family protein n=1 Tax=unclassified Dehalobacter TaxID=2635733 RepID=UPI000379ACD2|nr:MULTISPECIES: heparan-alpha-glucosaminide N-acetyltransferase domain-containing protein [unclassified Dehalobacter]RJE46984.1 N-acetylglucosamine transporter [Dehalobacter sp. MCB1]TCX50909.1 DUF1624 domain-containing protein [Dehalobacter sp. 12DCB1]TCX51621.1 DUF1624 domain-containing protein [Dehalobacter sp. 14DCB1]
MKRITNRIKALDFARALSVLLLFLTFVPEGPLYGAYITHAPWFGYTAIDFAFPAFVTLSGTSMAIAYRKHVPWGRLIRRFFVLIIIGLIFNSLVSWEFHLSELRLTGVLQVLAFTGIMTALIARVSGKWFWPFTAGLLILAAYLGILLYTSQSFPDSLPSPDHNLSGMIDPFIFTKSHLYVHGDAGYDPEGICTLFSAITSTLFGYTAGLFLNNKNISRNFLKILALAGVLLLLTPLLSNFIPIGKRLWTPSFVTLSSGATILVLAFAHLIWDPQIPVISKLRAPVYWVFEAIGRNAILLYFGSSMVFSVMHHMILKMNGNTLSVFEFSYNWVKSWSTNPQLGFIAIYTGLWVLLAVLLHWRKLYLTV